MSVPLKIAIAGLGTVGGGVIKALSSRKKALEAQAAVAPAHRRP